MQRWLIRNLYPLAAGGITLSIWGALQNINFNDIWFNFLSMLLQAIITLLFGGIPSTTETQGTSSPFGSSIV